LDERTKIEILNYTQKLEPNSKQKP